MRAPSSWLDCSGLKNPDCVPQRDGLVDTINQERDKWARDRAEKDALQKDYNELKATYDSARDEAEVYTEVWLHTFPCGNYSQDAACVISKCGKS